VWVTEPDNEENKQIEVFMFSSGDKPSLSHVLSIPFSNGPESLVIDHTHQRAYTNLDKEAAVIDVRAHKIVAQWPNSCEKSRGTALDKQRGFLFVGCGEGKAVVLDVNQNGKQLASLSTGPGVDL